MAKIKMKKEGGQDHLHHLIAAIEVIKKLLVKKDQIKTDFWKKPREKETQLELKEEEKL